MKKNDLGIALARVNGLVYDLEKVRLSIVGAIIEDLRFNAGILMLCKTPTFFKWMG